MNFAALIAALPPQPYSPRFFLFAVGGTFLRAGRALDVELAAAKTSRAYLVTGTGTVLFDPNDRV